MGQCCGQCKSLRPSLTVLTNTHTYRQTVDRGHGYTISGDRQHFIGSMEVVLPSGEILRTGQWSVPNSPAAHICANNFGPQVDGLFLQSNLGIVTKIAVAVDVAPASFMDVKIHCPEVEDIGPLIDTLQQLDREGITQSHSMVTNINHFASHDAAKHEQQTHPGPLLPETITYLKEKYKTGYWRCVIALYGPKSLVLARMERIKEVVPVNIPTAWLENKFYEGENGRPVDNTKIGSVAVGIPSMGAVKLADYNLPADGTGAGAHIDTTLVLPCEGGTVTEWFKKAKAIMEKQGVDPFIGCHVFSKYILFVQEYVFDKTNAKHREGGRKIIKALLAEAEKNGFANYRSHVSHMGKLRFPSLHHATLEADTSSQMLFRTSMGTTTTSTEDSSRQSRFVISFRLRILLHRANLAVLFSGCLGPKWYHRAREARHLAAEEDRTGACTERLGDNKKHQ